MVRKIRLTKKADKRFDEIALRNTIPNGTYNLVRRPNIHFQRVELFHVVDLI